MFTICFNYIWHFATIRTRCKQNLKIVIIPKVDVKSGKIGNFDVRIFAKFDNFCKNNVILVENTLKQCEKSNINTFEIFVIQNV